jgi:hypothetical protein
MQNAEGGGVSARSENPNDGYRSIVPELVSSIAHIQASRSVIAMEPALSNQDVAADIGMLDGVTVRYQNAKAASNTCNLRLEVPFHLLLDNKTSQHGTRLPNTTSGRFARPAAREQRRIGALTCLPPWSFVQA